MNIVSLLVWQVTTMVLWYLIVTGTQSRQRLRDQYPSDPNSDISLEAQQRALLRNQQQRLEDMRKAQGIFIDTLKVLNLIAYICSNLICKKNHFFLIPYYLPTVNIMHFCTGCLIGENLPNSTVLSCHFCLLYRPSKSQVYCCIWSIYINDSMYS